jgi:hypothetical protein
MEYQSDSRERHSSRRTRRVRDSSSPGKRVKVVPRVFNNRFNNDLDLASFPTRTFPSSLLYCSLFKLSQSPKCETRCLWERLIEVLSHVRCTVTVLLFVNLSTIR